ncbi:MAG: DNA-binding protein [Flavobacteriaceae bacterium]|nr:MAG: DNA-binding protein [Flavobacteriaceae bacterium]
MRDALNPFETINNQLNELKKIVLEIKDKPRDYSLKHYTRKQAAAILKCSRDTLSRYINTGQIAIIKQGERLHLINHYQLYSKNNELKEFRYKRTKA